MKYEGQEGMHSVPTRILPTKKGFRKLFHSQHLGQELSSGNFFLSQNLLWIGFSKFLIVNIRRVKAIIVKANIRKIVGSDINSDF